MELPEAVNLVLAQAAPRAFDAGLIPLVLIVVIFYFLLVRPQQKRAKEHKQLVEGLKKNDQVVTAGGVHGRIVEVSEHTVTLEIAPNVQIRHDRSQISTVTNGAKAKKGSSS